MAGNFGRLETWASNFGTTDEDKRKYGFVSLVLLPSLHLQRIIQRNKCEKFVSVLPLEREV